jgi:Flp pilus assembly protein CpaB
MATGGRRSGTIFIIIAILLVVALAVAGFIFRDQIFPPAQPPETTPVAPPVETVDIMVLSQPVPLGGVITENNVTKVPFPKDKFISGFYFTDPSEVVGKRARYPLQALTVLTAGLLSETPVGGFASSQIPPGYVGISVPLEMLNAVSWAIQPGDHVTVLVSLMLTDLDPDFQTQKPNTAGTVKVPCVENGVTTLCDKTISISPSDIGRTELEPSIGQPMYVQPSETQRPRIVSQVLISDATVLGIGDFSRLINESNLPAIQPTASAPTPTPVPGATPTPVPQGKATDNVTLIVSPQDAVTLNYVMLNAGAKLNLVLRSASDTKQIKTEAVTLQFLMDQYNIPLPSKLPYGLQPPSRTLNNYNSYFNLPEAQPVAPLPTTAPAQ